MAHEVQIHLALYADDFDPTEVTRHVGLAPTATSMRGTPIPRQTSWKVSGERFRGDVVDVYVLSDLLATSLGPYAEALARAIARLGLEAVFEVELWIDVNGEVSMPAIGFTHNTIQFIHSIGASIDVDTYRNAA